MLGICQISIQEYWWPIIKMNRSSESDRCSSFIATGNATVNGEIVLAHNTWDSYYIGGKAGNCILEIITDYLKHLENEASQKDGTKCLI